MECEGTKGIDIEEKIINLTPSMANALLKLNTGNRKIVKSHVSDLKHEMARGAFYRSTIILSKDKKRLRDGQHRCLACVESNVDIPVVIIYSDESVTNLDPLPQNQAGKITRELNLEIPLTPRQAGLRNFAVDRGIMQKSDSNMSNIIRCSKLVMGIDGGGISLGLALFELCPPDAEKFCNEIKTCTAGVAAVLSNWLIKRKKHIRIEERRKSYKACLKAVRAWREGSTITQAQLNYSANS